MTDDITPCVPPEHLFALVWAKRDLLPTGEGEEDDQELVRLRADLEEAERYKTPPLPEHLLGEETAARYWAHMPGCPTCRCQLIEDSPSARPPKTEAELEAEAVVAVEKEEGMRWKFALDLTLGLAFFGGAFATINYIRNKNYNPDMQSSIQAVGKTEIDPLYILFVVLILLASWFLAEAYGIAKELWIDFTAWKRAVPVVGKAWADKSKKKPPTRIGGEDG
jgi:hypothetical protein